MTYQYENVKLEKGMYGQNGKSFLKVLEGLDPSESSKGTALEGLDAFQRQLKRFDIHVCLPRGAPGHGERHSARHHCDGDKF